MIPKTFLELCPPLVYSLEIHNLVSSVLGTRLGMPFANCREGIARLTPRGGLWNETPPVVWTGPTLSTSLPAPLVLCTFMFKRGAANKDDDMSRGVSLRGQRC